MVIDTAGTVTVAQPQTWFNARYYGRDEVVRHPCPVPKSPGIYGWWCRDTPGAIETGRCEKRDGLTLLYSGISPSRPPTNGKPPSSQSLLHRIRYHYTGNAEGSTLRKTLGVLLAHALSIRWRRAGSGTRPTSAPPARPRSASQWMADNAFVSRIVDDETWVLEENLVATLDVALNIQGNGHNLFYPTLKKRRADAEQAARNLPVI